MSLEKLSNKALVRYIEELKSTMALASAGKVENHYPDVEAKYNWAMDEWRKRTECLGDFQRLKRM